MSSFLGRSKSEPKGKAAHVEPFEAMAIKALINANAEIEELQEALEQARAHIKHCDNVLAALANSLKMAVPEAGPLIEKYMMEVRNSK